MYHWLHKHLQLHAINVSWIGLLMACQQTCNSSSLRRLNFLLTWDELIPQAPNGEDYFIYFYAKAQRISSALKRKRNQFSAAQSKYLRINSEAGLESVLIKFDGNIAFYMGSYRKNMRVKTKKNELDIKNFN